MGEKWCTKFLEEKFEGRDPEEDLYLVRLQCCGKMGHIDTEQRCEFV
jgi:hypothetical protein